MKSSTKILLAAVVITSFAGAGFMLSSIAGKHAEHAGSSADTGTASVPEKDDRGFYTVGNYKLKVDVLDANMMADDAAVMMAGENSVRVTVLDSDGNPQEGAVVRIAAQQDSAPKAAMASGQDGHMAGMDAPTESHDDMSSDEHAGDAMDQEHAGAEHAGDAMPMENAGEAADEHAGEAMEQEHAGHAAAEHAGEAMSMEPASDKHEHHDHASMNDKQTASSEPLETSAVTLLRGIGEGVYQGQVTLPGDGDYVLAVDVSAPGTGHGDLVLSFTTGEYGLRGATATAEGVAYYTCSMHPSVREAEPGQCPICSMDLIPVSNEQVSSGVITVDSRRRQMIGVKTGQAQLRELTKSIRAVGTVGFDERRVRTVSLKFDAWIADLQADFVGARVDKGQHLFSVYSPELLSAQQEYLETRQRLSDRDADDSLVAAARRRLMLWDISARQVRALEQRGQVLEYLPIHAPVSGTVVEKMINDGSAMKRGDMLMRVADLSTVWVDAEVYEADLPLVEVGMPATVSLPYQAGAQFDATVDFIYPYLAGGTRTARIRLELDNPDGVLKPDMYAEVRLNVSLGRRLVVPAEAVLVSGLSRVVFKDLGEDGKLKPVRVRTGQRVDDWLEITAGLSPGDTIVTSGNFLIASEAKLKTGIEQW